MSVAVWSSSGVKDSTSDTHDGQYIASVCNSTFFQYTFRALASRACDGDGSLTHSVPYEWRNERSESGVAPRSGGESRAD